MPTRRTLAAALLCGPAAIGLPGCAGWLGPPRIVLGPAEITRSLQRQFPQERRLLDVLDVAVGVPQIRLLPLQNRVAALVDLNVRERILGGRWSGQLDFDAALRWDAPLRTLRLAEPRVLDLRLARGAANEPRAPGERLGAALAERLLDGLALYVMPSERAEQLRQWGVAPDGVTVTARGVEITFVAAAR